MKARGVYLIGIDFGDGDKTDMWVVPVRGHAPFWQKAERVTKEQFERLVDEARDRDREKRRAIDEARERLKPK